RQPQPVPPIYEPEVAARAIVTASESRKREFFVGAPTVIAVEGTKALAGAGDRYLGATGYDSQMTKEPLTPNRQDNLFAAVSGDFAAEGRFGGKQYKIRDSAWVTSRPGTAVLAGLAGLA